MMEEMMQKMMDKNEMKKRWQNENEYLIVNN